MRITCALHKAGHWDARSATSSPSPCAEGTIARSITAAMKQCGGKPPELIRRLLPVRYGGKRIRCLMAKDSEGIDKSSAAAGQNADAKRIKRNGSIDREGSNYKTKPIIAAVPQ